MLETAIRVKKINKKQLDEGDELYSEQFAKLFTMSLVVMSINDLYFDFISYGNYNHKIVSETMYEKYLDIYMAKSEPEVQIPVHLINPDGNFYKSFSIFTMLLLLYTITYMPYSLAFLDPPAIYSNEWFMDVSVDLIFMVDLVVNFFLPFTDEMNVLVLDQYEIARVYLASWFFIDLMSCMPFNLISLWVSSANSSFMTNTTLLKVFRLPRIWKMFKLLRIFKVAKYIMKHPLFGEILEYMKVHEWVLQMFKFFGFVFFGVHIMGCVWYLGSTVNGIDCYTDTWLKDAGMLVYDADCNLIKEASNIHRYVACIYWSIITLTTIGYGDIHAYSNLEMIISIFWMLVGVGFYSYTIGTLTSVISNIENNNKTLYRKLTIIEQFAQESKLSKNLRRKVREALEYNSSKTNYMWFKKYNIFDELPLDLQYEVSLGLHYSCIKKFLFFFEKPKEFVVKFAPLLMPVKYEINDEIYKIGEIPRNVFFVQQGRINFMTKEGLVFKTFISGSYFGEIEIIFDQNRINKAKAELESNLFYLDREDFISIKTEFREDWLQLKEIAAEKNARLMHSQYKIYLNNYLRYSYDQNKENFESYKSKYVLSTYMQELITKYEKYTQMKLSLKIYEKAQAFKQQVLKEIMADASYVLRKKNKYVNTMDIEYDSDACDNGRDSELFRHQDYDSAEIDRMNISNPGFECVDDIKQENKNTIIQEFFKKDKKAHNNKDMEFEEVEYSESDLSSESWNYEEKGFKKVKKRKAKGSNFDIKGSNIEDIEEILLDNGTESNKLSHIDPHGNMNINLPIRIGSTDELQTDNLHKQKHNKTDLASHSLKNRRKSVNFDDDYIENEFKSYDHLDVEEKLLLLESKLDEYFTIKKDYEAIINK